MKSANRSLRLLGLTLAAIATVAMTLTLSPDLRWRGAVIWAKATGKLPEASALQLVRWMAPGSPVHLSGLIEKQSLDASVHNLISSSPEAIERGAQLFKERCAVCHGADARGGSAPNLIDFVSRATDWRFLSTVKWGRPGTAMAAQPVSDSEIWQVQAWVRSRARAWVAEAAGPAAQYVVDVPASRLVAAAKTPEEWLTYSGDFAGHRHSALAQIDKQNVHQLRVAWAAQLRPSTKPMSATPIVTGGLIFVSEAPDGVAALDARTGSVVWRFTRPLDVSKLPLCCGAFNRGVAVLGKRVFVGTLDARLVALDATTGEKLWETMVGDPKEGFSITSAPLAYDGHVVIGVAGGEYGIRGLVAAFDPESGVRRWQFEAVPGPGEPGHETWAGDSWKTGGASTWSIGSLDVAADTLYWTVGNPWPPLDTRVREGDNLYSNSVVALDPATGKLRWHFQFTPADAHDWDATQQVILADVTWQGARVPALLMASRNAFYYALDRRDGRFLYAKPFVKQTWATSMGAQGRPVRDPATLPSPQGTLVWPWMHGGTNWWAPSYDARRHLHYVPTVDAATLYFSIDGKYKRGAEMTLGGTTQLAANQPAIMAVKAIDPDTGEIRWSTRLDKGDFHAYSRIPGLLSTDGGLLVSGFADRMSILDADTGAVLWKFRPGGLMNAGPATYAVDGRQHIAVIAGNVLFSFALP